MQSDDVTIASDGIVNLANIKEVLPQKIKKTVVLPAVRSTSNFQALFIILVN